MEQKKVPGDEKADEQKYGKHHRLSFQDKQHQRLLHRLAELEMVPSPEQYYSKQEENKISEPISHS